MSDLTTPPPPLVGGLLTISDHIASTGNWITTITDALSGIEVTEAAWKPLPEERSIWEIAAHMLEWTEWAVHFAQGKDSDPVEWPPIPDTGEAAWEQTRRNLLASLALLRERIAALTPEQLFEVPLPQVTKTNRFLGISSILIHNAYHAGQITKIRERYRSR